MKVRTGFVSNSSSSSFIVAVPKDSAKAECPTCGQKSYADVESIKTKLERSSYCDTEWDYHTSDIVESLAEYRNHFWVTEGEETEDELNMIDNLKKYGKDHEILMGSISNHDEDGWDIFDHEDVIILYQGEC